MASIKLRNGIELSDFGKPYFVAELNTSHFGDLDIARQMILRAREVGCDCVKFQSWSTQSLYSKSFYDANPVARRMIGKFALAEDSLRDLARFAKSAGIAFASTPYSRQEVEFLIEQCDVPFIKVASMELNNLPFLDFIARTGAPMVLSTGMGDLGEIRAAVETIANAGNRNLCILHCVSTYPAAAPAIRLNNILGLRDEFPEFPIGYSDHSLGPECAAASVALGACLIEKHFTLDHNKLGMDNQMATEPAEMTALVLACRNVHEAMGSRERIVPAEESEQRLKMRRSIIAAHELKQGTRITAADLDAKRPGSGLPPTAMATLIGKVAIRDIEADTLIRECDVSD